MEELKIDIRIPILMTIAILAGGLALSPVYGQANTSTQRFIFPTDFPVTSCSGETVKLSGSFMVIFHLTVGDTGRQIDFRHDNFQGVKAVGLDTGTKYQVTGTSNLHTFYVTPGSQFTDISQFHLLGQGAGNDLRVYFTLHFTVNSDGKITANVDNFKGGCG